MQSWTEFAKKYALQKNILYDNALESDECQQAYQRYKAELRERHKARIQNLSNQVQRNVEEAKRERHRARVLAMNTKVEQLAQQERVVKNQRTLISELMEKIKADEVSKQEVKEITCMTTPEPPPPPPPPPRPSPPPPPPPRNPTGYYVRSRSCGRQRINMFFTMKFREPTVPPSPLPSSFLLPSPLNYSF
jgi:hypothetical protein